MTIGIVASGYTPGQMGGTEVYLRRLVSMCQLLGSEAETVLYVSAMNRAALEQPLNGLPGLREINPTLGQLARRVRVHAGRLLRRQYYLGQLEDRIDYGRVDLLHFPFCIVRPIPRNKVKPKVVVTIHDLQHVEYPQFFSRRELDFREREYGLAVESADLILTDSIYSQGTITRHYGLDLDRVKVVYPGIDEKTHDNLTLSLVKTYLEAKGIQRPYMIYPAATWPHKNHKRLLLALKDLISSSSFEGDIVLTGMSRQSHGEIENLAAELRLSSHVKFVGFVQADDLRLLYAGARMLVYPSLYEGFGFPVIEAMSVGLPVLCSNCTSLPEIGTDAVEYCDPTDVDSMAISILNLWTDEDRRAQLRSLGLKRAEFFEVSARAAELKKAYQSIGS
ncbi:MAG TPA: glycosyltransferase family 1 protein [Bacteroidota bacterium]